jgi:hypothetical protein
MRVRRLNQRGLQRLADELERIRSGQSLALSRDLEQSDEFSLEVVPPLELERLTFANRFALAEYLHRRLGNGAIDRIEDDIGVWAWLSVFMFDQLCPPDRQGRHRPGEVARWIPDPTNFKKYYRHLLAGPFRIYRLHSENPRRAMAMLSGPPDKPGELHEQLASRQELVTNAAIVQTATNLYLDSVSGEAKRGASGSGPGSVRRFAVIMRQYDVTWDLSLISHTELLKMLPREFDRFRS